MRVTEHVAECRELVVEYGSGDARVRALDGVDFSVRRRERVALRGRSGSGKTTLLHVLGGLLKPTRGSVEVEGESLAAIDETVEHHSRRLPIAFVFQGSNLLPTLTAFENVAFAARQLGDRKRDPRLAPLALLRLVGLEGKADHLPAELSGGEAQRVAIARALGQRPSLLLCDEPTGQLDTDTGERVLDLVDALQNEFGFTLVTATHDDKLAQRFGRIVELEDGRVVENAA
jgi:putative ABC transport system ATP-binding protein